MPRASARLTWTTFLAFLLFAGPSPAADGAWPGLRGPAHDGAVRQARLSAPGKPSGLAVAWKKALGSGYSMVSVEGDLVVTLFAAGDADVAAGFDAATGAERWRHRIGDAYKGHDGSHDGPISTAVLAQGRVHGLGPRGRLFTLEAATGKEIWSKDLVAEHGAAAPHYGFTTSPIVVDGVLVVEIGAGAGKTIAGFDPADGRLLWTAGDDTIAYHSPIAATIDGKVQVVAAGKKTILGIDAASGKVIWSHAHEGDNAATGGETIVPVPSGEGRFLLLNKSDSSAMIQVTRKGEDHAVEQIWSNNSFRGTYVIPVYHEGHLYGMTGRLFTCVDAATGETRWRSREAGDGFPTLVGSHLVIMTKPGTLLVAEASPEGYKETARLELFPLDQSWSAVSFAGGALYARSMTTLARVEPSAAAGPSGPPVWIARTVLGRFLDEVKTAPDKNAAVESFLSRQKTLPIVEEDGTVHFLYRGEAKDVGIVGDMIGFRREDPMTRVPGTDLFHYSARLEPDAAVHYGFIVDYGKPVADPRNPRPGKGLFGDVSWMSMPAWRPPAYETEAPKEKQGRLEPFEIESKVKEEPARRVSQVYLPAGYDSRKDARYPVLYVHDGKEALDTGGMKNALDHLIGASIEPLIAVFVMPDEKNPHRDLDDVEPYARMIVEELVPAIDRAYRTLPDPLRRATAGAAGGANASLHLAFKHPGVFGRVGSHGAFLMKGAEYEPMIPRPEEHPLVIYLNWGTYHLRSPHEAWDMARGNRELWALLRERGHRPAGGETPDGFGWPCWKARIAEMLSVLFPLSGERRAAAGRLP
ncbi:MAG TPA: PQQ-binding-like beta-propeller repeat protein [Candidatus Polarisedimenticolia bacterium]|nr:PQQ-binding-like beta-propeller repeat protein [Candidatus Polarisedimenticolia bacterium]